MNYLIKDLKIILNYCEVTFDPKVSLGFRKIYNEKCLAKS